MGEKLKIGGEWTKRATFAIAISIFASMLALILIALATQLSVKIASIVPWVGPSWVWLLTEAVLLFGISFFASILLIVSLLISHIATG